MSRDDARRAALLSDAFDALPELAEAIDAPYEADHGYTQMLVMIGLHECGPDPYDGGSGAERIFVDRKTAARIAVAAREIITEELTALGVSTLPIEQRADASEPCGDQLKQEKE